jgi:hypothetical protein
MDAALHAERLEGRVKRRHRLAIEDLPDGAFVTFDGREAFAVRGSRLLRWTPSGYDDVRSRPARGEVDVLTPPSILAVLAAGYLPLWHPSAE